MTLPLHVDDIAEVFLRVTLAEETQYSIYNSGGESTSLGALADIVREFLPEAEITFGEDEGGRELSGLYLMDNSRLVEEFEVEYAPSSAWRRPSTRCGALKGYLRSGRRAPATLHTEALPASKAKRGGKPPVYEFPKASVGGRAPTHSPAGTLPDTGLGARADGCGQRLVDRPSRVVDQRAIAEVSVQFLVT